MWSLHNWCWTARTFRAELCHRRPAFWSEMRQIRRSNVGLMIFWCNLKQLTKITRQRSGVCKRLMYKFMYSMAKHNILSRGICANYVLSGSRMQWGFYTSVLRKKSWQKLLKRHTTLRKSAGSNTALRCPTEPLHDVRRTLSPNRGPFV